MMHDYLLVGHGLAGSILAQTLAEAGYKILVIDEPKENSASNVAAGLINPLAGKRFAKSWLADVFVPFATDFYRSLEDETNQEFFHQKPILKLFSSIEEQNNWMGKSAGATYGEFITDVFTSLPPSEEVYQEQGGIVIDKGGYVDVPVLIASLRQERIKRDELISGTFNFNDLRVNNPEIIYQDIRAKNIIFCEGYQGAVNPFFKWLPFSLNKGEILDIESSLLPNKYIYNKAVYVVGFNKDRWRVGATYNWRQPDENTTSEGLAELETKLGQLLKKPFRVVEHLAGIRPAVRDRRPLIGTHPEYPVIKIFNGMGSKGVMMAPYLAHHFVKSFTGQELMPEVNILRYLSLYKEHIKLP
jgi:glycine oxidase